MVLRKVLLPWAYMTAALGGTWTVTVADASGLELKSLQFTVGEPAKKQPRQS